MIVFGKDKNDFQRKNHCVCLIWMKPNTIVIKRKKEGKDEIIPKSKTTSIDCFYIQQ